MARPPEPLSPPPAGVIDRVLRAALEEDLDEGGDVTSAALIPPQARGRARIVAEEGLVLCGGAMALRTFELLDPDARREGGLAEADAVAPGAVVLAVEARARALLGAERTALNLLGRLCGIATRTRRVVEGVQGTPSAIFDTRKTTPGLRLLEKYAVRCGGGRNHRLGLHDMALIKENHIALVGGIGEAVRRVRQALERDVPIEVEVEDLAGLEEAIAAGADLVLLDNVDTETLAEAMQVAAGRVVLEASGGISPERAAEIARTSGVDRISLGTLTRGAVWSDLSMDVELLGEPR